MENARLTILHRQVDVRLVLGGMEQVVSNRNHVARDFIKITQESVNSLILEGETIQGVPVLCLPLDVEIMLGGIMEHVLVEQR